MRCTLAVLILTVISTSLPGFSSDIICAAEDQALEKKFSFTKTLIENLREKGEEAERVQKFINQKDEMVLSLLSLYISFKQYQKLPSIIGDVFDAFKNKNLVFSENSLYSHHLFAMLGWLILNKNDLSLVHVFISPMEEAARKIISMNLENQYLSILIHQICGQSQDQFEQNLDAFHDVFYKRGLPEKTKIEKFVDWADDIVFENFPCVLSQKQEYKDKDASVSLILNPWAPKLLGYIDLLRNGDIERSFKGFSEVSSAFSAHPRTNSFEEYKLNKCFKDVHHKQWFELLYLASKMFFEKNAGKAQRY